MPKVLFDVRDYERAARGKSARVKLLDTESGEEIEAHFSEQHQQFVAPDLKPGRYRVVVEDDAPELEKEEREIEIKPEEAKRKHPLRKRVFLRKKGMPVYYQGEEAIPYERKPQHIAVDFRPTKKDLNEPLPVELDDGTEVELKPTLEERPGESRTTRVFEAENLSQDQIKQVMTKLVGRDDVGQVGQILHSATDDRPTVYLSDTLTISFKEGVSKQEVKQIVLEICGDLIKAFRYLPLSNNMYELQLENTSYEVTDMAEALDQHEKVVRVELNLFHSAALDSPIGSTDPDYHKQENYLKPIDAPAAWRRLHEVHPDLAFGSPEVSIGILDKSTVVNVQKKTHVDLEGNLTDNQRKLVKAWDIQEVSDHSQEVDAHPFNVAGLATAIAGNDQGIAGIAGNCHLISVGLPIPVRENNEYKLDPNTVARALVWMSGHAVEDDDRFGQPPPNPGADVINNSWSFSQPDSLSTYLPQILETLATEGRNGKGIPLVFSTGNEEEGRPIDNFPLHTNEFVINVGASYQGKRATYSGHGQRLDVCAPSGEDRKKFPLYTLGVDDYQLFGGTSGAAALVSGALALAISANQELTREQVTTLLQASAEHIDYPHGEWNNTDDDGVPDFSEWYGHGRLNVGRMVRLALLAAQNSVYMRANANDSGDLFSRPAPAWDSPDLIVDPTPATPDQDRRVHARVFNRSDESISVKVSIFAVEPTTLVNTADSPSPWLLWLGTVAFDIPPGENRESPPLNWPAGHTGSHKMLFATLRGGGHLPNIFDMVSPADYATLARWTGRLAWRQPDRRSITLSPGSSDKFSFYIGRFKGSKPWTTLCFDLSKVPQGVQVSIKLAKSLVDSLLKNNNDQFPPGVEKKGEDAQGITLNLDPSQVANNDKEEIFLRGLELSKYRHPIQLIQTYPATPDVYPSSISVSQYIEGHWVGMVKHQVEATVE
jgi:hypothetical protein